MVFKSSICGAYRRCIHKGWCIRRYMVEANSHQWSIAGEDRKCKVCGLVAHSLSDVLIKNQQPCEPKHVEAYIVGIMDEVTFINLQTNASDYKE